MGNDHAAPVLWRRDYLRWQAQTRERPKIALAAGPKPDSSRPSRSRDSALMRLNASKGGSSIKNCLITAATVKVEICARSAIVAERESTPQPQLEVSATAIAHYRKKVR